MGWGAVGAIPLPAPRPPHPPLKTAPTYERLRHLEAEFGEKAGWERPNWFRTNEDDRLEHLRPRDWAGEHWSTAIPAEHEATREHA